jgi:predicted DsbA family dithiol-disulfide isomerase
MEKTIKIEVVSDFACPWCYMGKRRLNKALKLRPDLKVDIKWSPYQLNPDMPPEGKNRNIYYIDKFGEEQFKAMLSNLKQIGLEEKINFCDSEDAVAPNTLAAHRLMYWASQDRSVNTNLLQEKIFKAHHEDCEDIGSTVVLARIASELGMQEDDIKKKLDSKLDEELIKKQIKDAYKLGVSGVPFFIINDKYTISGAQEADYLICAFDQIAAKDEN